MGSIAIAIALISFLLTANMPTGET